MVTDTVGAIHKHLDALCPLNESFQREETKPVVMETRQGTEGAADMRFNVGGHGKRSADLAVLAVDNGENVSKVLSDDRKGASEHYFYEVASRSPLFAPLKPYLPVFKGTSWNEQRTQRRIVLSNLLRGFDDPDVMDIKIGGVSWDPDASASKVDYKKTKWCHQFEIALNVEGCHVGGVHHGKGVWREIQDQDGAEEGIRQALLLFFESRHGRLMECLVQLGGILAWFRSQMAFHFVNSSILFVSDRDRIGVFMVDFAHVWPANNTIDHECIRGLARLDAMLRGL